MIKLIRIVFTVCKTANIKLRIRKIVLKQIIKTNVLILLKLTQHRQLMIYHLTISKYKQIYLMLMMRMRRQLRIVNLKSKCINNINHHCNSLWLPFDDNYLGKLQKCELHSNNVITTNTNNKTVHV